MVPHAKMETIQRVYDNCINIAKEKYVLCFRREEDVDSTLAKEENACKGEAEEKQQNEQNDPILILGIVLSSLLFFWSLGVLLFPLGEPTGTLSDLSMIILPKWIGVVMLFVALAVFSQTDLSRKGSKLFLMASLTALFPICIAIDVHVTEGNTFIRAAAYVFFGIGQACFVSLWAACVSKILDNRQIGLCTVVSGAVSAILFIGAFAFYRSALLACMSLALVVSLVLLFYFSSWQKSNGKFNEKISMEASALAASGSDCSAQNEERSLNCDRPTPKLFAFIGIQGVIYGVFFVAFLSLSSSVQSFVLLGIFLGILLAFFVELSKWRVSLSPNLGQRILSVIIATALALCNLGIYVCGANAGTVPCIYLLVAAGTFFLVTSYILLVVQSKEFCYSTVLHFSAGRTPVWAGVAFGMLVSIICMQLMSFNECFIVLANVLLIVQAISGAVHRPVDPVMGHLAVQAPQQETEAETEAVATTATTPGLFKMCALQVSHDCSLTPREQEIFLLLLKGRNSRYLQETLFISESTAKTHISNIYRKAGVRSKQELINQVERLIKQTAEEETSTKAEVIKRNIAKKRK